MKLRRLLLIASLLWGGLLLAQPGKVLPPAKDVDKEYRKEYRDDIKDWRKERRQDKRDQWDIVIPPEEDIPVQQYNELPPANADNWGVRILLPDGLKSRISKECKHPVVLKVADTGIQESHRDLQNNRLAGTDYTTSNTVDDEGGHGTHVAGIVVANNFGICDPLVKAGLLRFKSVKVLDKRSGSFTWYANMFATERAEDKRFQESGVSVVYNSSLGGGTTDIDFVEEELEKSAALGVTFVAASGNNNGPVSYPGRSTYSITAASLDQNLLRSSFSNFGAQVTGAMPGRNITSTYIGGGYATLSGTSMASPFLAGAACIAKAKWGPGKLPDYYTTRDYLEAVATDLGEEGFDDFYGAGVNYIVKILDTDPADVVDGPTPPPDEEPAPPNPDPEPGPEVTISTSFMQPIIFRYRTESEHRQGGSHWHVVAINYLCSQTTGTATKAEVHDALQKQFDNYFYKTSKLMVIPDGEGAADAIRYIPMFWYYYSREKGQPVFTREVVGYDEQGRKYIEILTDSRRGGAPYPKQKDIGARLLLEE